MYVRLLIPLLLISGALFADYPAHIKMIKGTPTLHINDQPIYASALRWLGGKGTTDKLLFKEKNSPTQQFGEAGIPVIMLNMEPSWKGEGLFDYSAIDRAIDKTLKDYPNAYLIPVIHLQSTTWYSSKYPDEAFTTIKKNQAFEKHGSYVASFSSERFKRDAKQYLTNFIEHMNIKGYSKNVIGYQISYGKSAEWRYWDYPEHRPDWNPQAVKAWQEFVKTKYKTIDCVNVAWKTSLSDFGAVTPPEGRFRFSYENGYLQDPISDRQKIDYRDFIENSISELQKLFTSHVKQLTSNRALVGVYFSRYCEKLPIPDSVDFIVSSTGYGDRKANGTALSQVYGLEYLRRIGKLYWHDSDMRTYLWPDDLWGVCRNVYESAMVMRREFTSMLINGAGNTWFNLNLHRNVYDNPVLMHTVAELQALAKTAVSTMDYDLSSSAEIAVIYDNASSPAFWERSAMLNNYTRIGAAVDFFPSNHLELIDPEQYKLIVLASCPYISEAGRRHIERLKGGGRTLLFLYANGMETDQGLNVKGAESLSGFSFKQLPGMDRKMEILPDWQSIFKQDIAELGKALGPSNAFRLVVVPKPGDKVIGYSPVDEKPLFVKHTYPDWTAFYFHNYQAYTHLLRQIAIQAGAEINFAYDDSYFQRNHYFWLINSGAGQRELNVGDKKHVYDIFNDCYIPVTNGIAMLNMQPNETKLLLTDTPARIQQFRDYYQAELKKYKISSPTEDIEITIINSSKPFYVMSGSSHEINVRICANRSIAGGELHLLLPEGWRTQSIPIGSFIQNEVKNFKVEVSTNSADENITAPLELTVKDASSSNYVTYKRSIQLFPRNFLYLSDMPFVAGTTGWGKIGYDLSCTQGALRVLQQTFAKGLGVHADSELIYQLNKPWRELVGLVGVDRVAGTGGMNRASCVFKIFGDDRELFNSGRRLGGEPAIPFKVNLIRVKQLRLVVESAGDGRKADHGNWCDVKLFP